MLKKIKSLFIVEEEGVVKPVESPDTTEDITMENVSPIRSSGPAKANKRFTEILLKAMDKQNIEGVDYLEYKESLKSLQNVISDEPTRYKSAFAMAQTLGLTKDKLLASGNHYMKVLEGEEQKFEKTYKHQQEVQIQDKQQEIKSINDSIQSKKQQLKQLEQEIVSFEKSLEAKKKAIQESALKVQETRDEFHASYNLIINQIKSDFENIKKYL